jgi:hypothetical protein
MTTEPDYTLTIFKTDAGWIVFEGGIQRSKAFDDEEEAKWWAHHHELWHQPRCGWCGSAVTRPDDPWEVYSSSCSTGADWFHRSCMKKFDPGAASLLD